MAIRRGRSRSSSPALSLSLVSIRTGSQAFVNDNGPEEGKNPPTEGYNEPELSEPITEDYLIEVAAAEAAAEAAAAAAAAMAEVADAEVTEPEPAPEPEPFVGIGWGALGSKQKMSLKEKKWREKLMSQAAQSPSTS